MVTRRAANGSCILGEAVACIRIPYPPAWKGNKENPGWDPKKPPYALDEYHLGL